MTARHWITTAIFALIAVVCVVGAVATISAPAEPSGAMSPRAVDGVEAISRPPLIAYDPLPMEAFPAVFHQPLFSADRLPFPGADAAPRQNLSKQGQTNGQLDAKLVGIVIAGNARFALLDSPGKDKPVRLRPGEQYKGWRLKSVRQHEATFSRAKETRTLSLIFTRQPSN